jgi:hypothetical protein
MKSNLFWVVPNLYLLFIYCLYYQDWKSRANTFPMRDIQFSLTRTQRFLFNHHFPRLVLGNYFSTFPSQIIIYFLS